MLGLPDAFLKLHIKARKAKDQVHDSKGSLRNGDHKAKVDSEKSIRGGFENDVRAKIVEVETPPSESDESSSNNKSGRKDLEDFKPTDEPTELREWYGRLPLVQSRE
jgi:hypothetical protein